AIDVEDRSADPRILPQDGELLAQCKQRPNLGAVSPPERPPSPLRQNAIGRIAAQKETHIGEAATAPEPTERKAQRGKHDEEQVLNQREEDSHGSTCTRSPSISTRTGRNFSTTDALVVRWSVIAEVLKSVGAVTPAPKIPDAKKPAGKRI